MNITDEEIKALEATNSEDEWNSVCDQIKKARGNRYPSDWWAKVKLTGLMDKIAKKWGGSSEIKLIEID